MTRDEAWRAVAKQRGGEELNGRRGKLRSVGFRHRVWTLVLDTYVVSSGNTHTTYTRARTLVDSPHDFRFTLYRENVFARVGKLFGMQDVQAGDPELDPQFIIKSNNESLIRSLLIAPAVRQALLGQRSGRFDLQPFRSGLGRRLPGVSYLRYRVTGVVKDPLVLMGILDLLEVTLDQLARIGGTREVLVDHQL